MLISQIIMFQINQLEIRGLIKDLLYLVQIHLILIVHIPCLLTVRIASFRSHGLILLFLNHLSHMDMLDCSVSGRNAYLLQSSQFRISETLDHPKDNSCECFAVPAKQKHIEENYKSDKTERSKFHAPPRTYAGTNFEHFLAHVSSTSAITKVRSLSFER